MVFPLVRRGEKFIQRDDSVLVGVNGGESLFQALLGLVRVVRLGGEGHEFILAQDAVTIRVELLEKLGAVHVFTLAFALRGSGGILGEDGKTQGGACAEECDDLVFHRIEVTCDGTDLLDGSCNFFTQPKSVPFPACSLWQDMT